MAKKAKKTSGLAKLTPKFEPIELNGFRLTSTGVIVPAGVRPSIDEYTGTFDFVARVHKFSGFWLADLIAYADTRPEWKEKIDQIIDAEVLDEDSVKQYRYVAKNCPPENRVEGVAYGHHAAVASLPGEDQTAWLEKSKEQGWTQRELKENIRAAERTKVIDGQAKLQGMYRVIYADPPWKYGDSGATKDGSLGKAERHYLGMTIEELCRLPVQAHAMPNSILFMWVTAPLLLQNPGPRDVIEAWGFEYKTCFVWDKVLGMRGHYSHVTHELVIVATRGSCLPDVPTPQTKSILVERRSNKHSEKPATMRTIIEKHWTRGPYVELFGRERVEGWDVFGNDARLWSENLKPPIAIPDDDVPF